MFSSKNKKKIVKIYTAQNSVWTGMQLWGKDYAAFLSIIPFDGTHQH